MSIAVLALIIGAILITMVLVWTRVERLPLSPGILYLALGYALGPAGWHVISPDPLRYSADLERITEVALLISLFAVGLKLGVPLRDKRWYLPLRLAFPSMVVTVLLLAVIAMFLFGLPSGAAVLLAAILAPTDPVLASDVQVEDSSDRDRLRFGLTAEGGLNDGTALPFVLLGLGMLGLYDFGTAGWRWVTVDAVWDIGGGLVIGGALGSLIGKLVVYLRTQHKEAVGLDEFLALGLIAIAYGVAQLSLASGFLAVFAAGLALQRIEAESTRVEPSNATKAKLILGAESEKEIATHAQLAGTYMMKAVEGFNGQLERIAELVVVMIAGAMLSFTYIPPRAASVRAAAVLRRPPGRGLARSPRGGERFPRPAPPHLVVRHPRRRLDLLPDVRDQPRAAGSARPGAHRHHADHRRRIRRAPRHLGNAADDALREAQGEPASLSGDSAQFPVRFRVNPSIAGNSYSCRPTSDRSYFADLPGYARPSPSVFHGTPFARNKGWRSG